MLRLPLMLCLALATMNAHAAKGGKIRRALDALADQAESAEQGAVAGTRIGLSRACYDDARARLDRLAAEFDSLPPDEQDAEVRASIEKLRATLATAAARSSTESAGKSHDSALCVQAGDNSVPSGWYVAIVLGALGLFIAAPAGIRRLTGQISDDQPGSGGQG